MAKMYLVCGMSGAGKTTYSKQFSKRLNIPHLDVDEFYKEFNRKENCHDNFYPVWINFFNAIHAYEIENQDIIVDTNALTKSQRDQFLEWFPTFEHHMIWITAPKEICFERNKKRSRVIPEDRMNDLYMKMESPFSFDEIKYSKWKTITIISSQNNDFLELTKIENEVIK